MPSSKPEAMETLKMPEIKTTNPDSRWVALDISTNAIIAEGETPEEVLELANKSGKQFTLMFVPIEGEVYIL